ncbi:MAG TPA: RsfS/YbeB/iojap family protein, partial [Candidatus Methylacidiphilales bacterium]
MPETSHAELTGLELAQRCAEYALDKKALDPIILDLRKISSIADYLVICSAQSEPQIKAIANG